MGIDIEVAESLDHALALLASGGPGTRPVAGATDLLLQLERGKVSAGRLVSIADLSELAYVRAEADHVEIGAGTLVAALPVHPEIAASCPCLARAAREFASPQIRNRATLGGNLANASPAADLAPPLIALGAAVLLKSRRGERSMPVEELFAGPGQTKLAADELLVAARVPKRPRTFQAFTKFGARGANVIAVVNMAMCLGIESGRVVEARVAYGCCAPVPLRARGVEAYLTGQPLGEPLARGVREAVLSDIRPIGDVRGSARYKATLAVHATRDALLEAFEKSRAA